MAIRDCPASDQKVEIAGIEPATLCMLSTRAANCAKSPYCEKVWKSGIGTSVV